MKIRSSKKRATERLLEMMEAKRESVKAAGEEEADKAKEK